MNIKVYKSHTKTFWRFSMNLNLKKLFFLLLLSGPTFGATKAMNDDYYSDEDIFFDEDGNEVIYDDNDESYSNEHESEEEYSESFENESSTTELESDIDSDGSIIETENNENTIPHDPNIRKPIPSRNEILISKDDQIEQENYFIEKENNIAELLRFKNHTKAIERIKTIIENSNDNHYNDIDSNGNSALMNAAKFGYINLVNNLILNSANVFYSNPKTKENAILIILKNPQTNNNTALSSEQKSIILELLNGENRYKLLDNKCPMGNALHLAIAANADQKIIAKIIDTKRSLINEQNALGNTPLHLAINLKNEFIISYLLIRNAEANIENKQQELPLILAIKTDQTNVVESLINKYEFTQELCQKALGLAVKNKKTDMLELLIPYIGPKHTREIGTQILQKNHVDNQQKKALLNLSEETYESANFINAIAQIQRKDENNIFKAIHDNRVKDIQDIMGADVNITNEWGFTPLMLAVILKRENLVEELLKKQANPEALLGPKNIHEILTILTEAKKMYTNEKEAIIKHLENAQKLKEGGKKTQQENQRNQRSGFLDRFEQNNK